MIETERLILRQFQESDAADLLEYLAVPAVNCFVCMKLDSLEAARAEIEKRLDDDLYLAIVLKESGKVIGEIFGHPEGTAPEDETLLEYKSTSANRSLKMGSDVSMSLNAFFSSSRLNSLLFAFFAKAVKVRCGSMM